MRMRLFGVGVLAAGLLAVVGGCGKTGPAGSAGGSAPLKAETIARIHWLGKERLSAETNAAYFMSLWRMPEAARLEAQTLDKLAAALTAANAKSPGRQQPPSPGLSTLNPQPSTNNAFRILLEDVVLKESYLELQGAGTNGPAEVAFAIRLTPERAALWQTNLATALESLTGTRPTPTDSGWDLTLDTRHPTPDTRHFAFTRAGDWTIVSLITSPAAGAQPSTLNSQLSTAFAARIQRDHVPFVPGKTNYWLESDLDLARLGLLLGVPAPVLSTLNPQLSTNSPLLSLRITGDGQNVRTAAELDFPHPLGLQLEPWNVPTNLVRDPLIGFMAIRGMRPWLASTRLWSDLGLGTAPNQAYFWAQHGLQRFHYLAMPSAEASNQVSKLGDLILSQVNPMISTAAMKLGTFHLRTNEPGVAWRGYPLLSPGLSFTNFGDNPFILASFSPTSQTNAPAPAALFQQLYGTPDLVWYDWERTGECADTLGQLAQMARHLFSKARLTHTAGIEWLIAASPKLGPAVTGIRAPGPNRLLVSRTSTVGLTGVELQVFIDWLESPEFPRGLHTLLAVPQPPPTAPPATEQKP